MLSEGKQLTLYRSRPSGERRIWLITPKRANRSSMPFTPGFLSGLTSSERDDHPAQGDVLQLEGSLAVRLSDVTERSRRLDTEVRVEVDALACIQSVGKGQNLKQASSSPSAASRALTRSKISWSSFVHLLALALETNVQHGKSTHARARTRHDSRHKNEYNLISRSRSLSPVSRRLPRTGGKPEDKASQTTPRHPEILVPHLLSSLDGWLRCMQV